jgi:hypothetical protein
VSRLVKRVSAAFSRFVHFSDQMQHLKLLRWPEQLRRRGFPHVPLHGLPGSSQFIEAYQAALGNIQPSARVGIRGAPGGKRVGAELSSLYQLHEPLARVSESSSQHG